MARTKLIVEITTRDEKTSAYECVDFPAFTDAFLILYRPDFKQELIRTETILKINRYFK